MSETFRHDSSMSPEEDAKVEEYFYGTSNEDWLCAMCIFSLARFFSGLEAWTDSLKTWTPSEEFDVPRGTHQGLHVGMSALSAAIKAFSSVDGEIAEQLEGDAVISILQTLVQERESERDDQQLVYLKKATDAVNDLKNGRHKKGHPKNVGLLEKAYTNAEDAARFRHGELSVKIQAYRLWIVTAYWHEVSTKKNCKDAKDEAMFILGHVILKDADLLRVCEKFATPGQAGDAWRWHQKPHCQLAVEDWTAAMVIEFLLEAISSITMLPPLDADVGRTHIVKVVGAGMKMVNEKLELIGGELVLGSGTPKSIVLAMGRYCALNRDAAQTYPSVSFLAMTTWEQDKERLAMDNFFVGMGGDSWTENGGWKDKDGDLRKRFGITVEDGHVTKICLAGNNLRGHLYDDLADCEHLRELVLHGNAILGEVPPRLECLLTKSNMIVTGLPRMEPRKHDMSLGDSSYDETSRVGSSHSHRGAARARLRDWPGVNRPPQFSHRDSSADTIIPPFIPSTISASTDYEPNFGRVFGGTPMSTFSSGTADSDSPEQVHGGRNTSGKKKGKRNSLFKKAAAFLKESAGSDFAAGYAQTCPECGSTLKYRNKVATCPKCFKK
ncbi:unnamed protein product [Ascophyllum nodosum]